VRDAPLRAIWDRGVAMHRARRRDTGSLWGYCATCYYAEDCLGGCTWTAQSLLGTPGNNPLCHHRALEMHRQGKRERLVPVAAPPGRPFDHGQFELIVEPLGA
jgi:radical SAM protein with 4Fe4S-binding SPASM domain